MSATISTNVPDPTFGPTGFAAPAESAILTGILADFNAAFTGNLNLSLSTPQGQLASSQAAIVGDKNAQFLLLTNSVDPAYASGRMQDAIGRIYFLDRIPSQPTVVQVTCSGAVNTPIPIGSLVKTPTQDVYICTQGGVIGAGGTVILPFSCTVSGPTACPANAISIFKAIPGWDSATNPAAGVLGRNTETRSEFELRRQQSVAVNARGTLASIIANVLGLPGVLDAYAVENATNAAVTIGGQALIANSLYVAVSGGNSAAIAKAIWQRKSLGCAYNGNTTVAVQDTNSGYNPPYPSYNVTFEIPTNLPIYVTVTLESSTAVPSTVQTDVQNAIIAAFAGADGGTRARIGSNIFASRFYNTVASLGAYAQIVSITIGTAATPTGTIVAVPINEVPVISASQIVVVLQ